MNVRALSLDRFGALDGRSLEFGPGANVVFGRNERGKSSLRSALRTALFGYAPATRSKHPLAQLDPGDEEILRVRAVIAFDDAETLNVERSLAPGPTLRTWSPGEQPPSPRRTNEAIEAASHVPPSVYDAIHCIDGGDATCGSTHFERHVRRLLSGDDLAPRGLSIDALRRSLADERGKLWRRGRRSRATVVAGLDERIAQASVEAREARRIERGLVELERSIVEQREALAVTEREVDAARDEVRTLELIERLARAARDATLDPGVRVEELDGAFLEPITPLLAELEDAEVALEEPRERIGQPPLALAAAQEAILAASEEIARVERTEREIARLRREVTELRDRAMAKRREAALLRGQHGPTGSRTASHVALATLAAAGAVGTVAMDNVWIGAASTVAVAALSVFQARRGANDTPEPAIADAAEREASGHASLADTHEAAIAEAQQGWRELAVSIGVQPVRTALVDDDDTPDRLRTAHENARQAEAEMQRDSDERGHAGRAYERAKTRRDRVAQRFDRVRDILARAVPEERVIERAHARASAALANRERLIGAIRELGTDRAWPLAMQHPCFESAKRNGTFDAQSLRTAEMKLEASEQAVTTQREALARAEERLARERPPQAPSEVDSEIASLRTERAAALARHDRLALCEAILDEAERRHRDTHTPRVLADASRWLDALTGGRYTRIEHDGDELTLRTGEHDRSVPLGPALSRGVREQAWLCLRLASAAAIEGDGEPLPLILDEALVHWDAARREQFWPVLGRIAESRQVFVLTCHGTFADEAETALAAPRIDL